MIKIKSIKEISQINKLYFSEFDNPPNNFKVFKRSEDISCCEGFALLETCDCYDENTNRLKKLVNCWISEGYERMCDTCLIRNMSKVGNLLKNSNFEIIMQNVSKKVGRTIIVGNPDEYLTALANRLPTSWIEDYINEDCFRDLTSQHFGVEKLTDYIIQICEYETSQ